MPNASRYLEPGYTYHLTHRCHDKRVLLRTIWERHDCRKWLREGANRYGVPIYNYCITPAIGEWSFVERAAKRIGNRHRFAYGDAGTSSPSAACVYGAGDSYGAIQQPFLSARSD